MCDQSAIEKFLPNSPFYSSSSLHLCTAGRSRRALLTRRWSPPSALPALDPSHASATFGAAGQISLRVETALWPGRPDEPRPRKASRQPAESASLCAHRKSNGALASEAPGAPSLRVTIMMIGLPPAALGSGWCSVASLSSGPAPRSSDPARRRCPSESPWHL